VSPAAYAGRKFRSRLFIAEIGTSLSGQPDRRDNYSGIASKIVRSGGMTAQAGRLRAKIAIFGWKPDGSSRVPA
jgi:hypothetical protein